MDVFSSGKHGEMPPEKTLTDGQENQKGEGGQQSEGEGGWAGEDLGEREH